jgi:hypothetical protein
MRQNIVSVGLLFENKTTFSPDKSTLQTALEAYINSYVSTVWGVSVSLSTVTDRNAKVDALLVFLDDTNQQGALGYHDFEAGKPVGYVFVETSEQDDDPVSVVASHELAELLIDPDADQSVQDGQAGWVAKEICDPVEASTFSVNGVAVSNFVTKNWFGGSTGPYDYLGVLSQAFQLTAGGYAIVWKPGQGWQDVYGLRGKRKRPGAYRRLTLRRGR